MGIYVAHVQLNKEGVAEGGDLDPCLKFGYICAS